MISKHPLYHLCCGDRLIQLGLFSLEKTLGRHQKLFQYLKGAQKELERDF